MARMHGRNVQVLLGGRDASGDLISITPKLSADTHDTHTCGDAWKEATPGLLGWEAELSGFYDPAVGGIGRQFEALLGATGGIVSIIEGDANAIGDQGLALSDAILTSREQPIAVADLIKLSGNLQGSGRAGLNARLLHVLGQETITGVSASHNNSASSASGGRGNLHVTAITGTWTIVIEHSDNDGAPDPWAALITFTQVAAAGGATSETKEVTGTVKQYVRVTFTEDVAGSITFGVALARY